jgi:sarcosine oxidase subunit delta
MRIPCPYCGERDAEEFSIQGEAAGPRPIPSDYGDGDRDAFHAYVHLRANEYGPTREYWYHAAGCRRWLTVSRDTRDHKILGVELAKP